MRRNHLFRMAFDTRKAVWIGLRGSEPPAMRQSCLQRDVVPEGVLEPKCEESSAAPGASGRVCVCRVMRPTPSETDGTLASGRERRG